MRIAMFTDTYLPSRDGVVSSILLTRKGLEALGHEVIILAPEPPDRKDREDGVHYFKSKSFASYPGYYVPIFPADNCSLLRKLGVDVVHSHGMMFMGLRSMLAARDLRIPVVVTFHTMVSEAVRYYNFTPIPDRTAEHLLWFYMRELLERADAVIAPTNATKGVLNEFAPGMRRVEVIPTGVDTNRFSPLNDGSAMRRELGLDEAKVVLTVGRIAWEKNLDLVLRGFRLLHAADKGTKLVIAGKGPAETHIKGTARDLGIDDSTCFPGFVPDVDLPGLYSACDAFTIASKFETQGLALLDAMATGKPVSGINYRAVGEIIDDCVNGFTFYETPECWAVATATALNAGPEIGIRARQKAEEYSVQQCAMRTVALYEHAIQAKAERLVMEKWPRAYGIRSRTWKHQQRQRMSFR
ncbi:glycosyltransferase [Methanomassiliicoccus luminyensis]|uniref:glycosyltransferase n=1 Tax=Methanomassiliicoccus luminyensis TaxID=1080712 RepID=UPI00036B2B66|nr:glycosyltransferase [Methanomassiliicoccus luminyensis]